MSDDKTIGNRDGEKTLSRQCAVTRISRPVDELVRFVLDPEDNVVPDLKHVLPGRGVWVTAARDLVEEAVKRNVFARAFRKSVHFGQDLPELVEELLMRSALQSLSLAKKSGLLTSGFSKVDSLLVKKSVLALLHASDASEDGCSKLDRKFQAVSREAGRQGQLVNCFTSEQLSLALGRANVIHAAIQSGGASLKLLASAASLARYKSGRQAYEAA